MSKFIELTGLDEEKFLLNVDVIERVDIYDGATFVRSLNTAQWKDNYRCLETYEEVRDMIWAATNQTI